MGRRFEPVWAHIIDQILANRLCAGVTKVVDFMIYLLDK